MLDYLLKAMDDAVIAFNLNEQSFMFISEATEKITGYPNEDFNNKKDLWRSIIMDDDRHVFDDLAKNSVSPSEEESTYRILTKSKQIKWIHDKRVCFFHPEKACTIVLHIVKDVTDVVNYREETEKQVWFLNSLIDSQESLTFRIDINGNYSYINQGYANLLGYNKDELIGKPLSYISPAEDLALLQQAFKDGMEHPGKIMHLLHRKLTKAGKVHWVEANYVAVTDQNNKVTEIQGTGIDVTELIESKKNIQQILDKLAFYMDSITDSFMILDKDWKFVQINSAFEKLVEKVKSEVLGLSIWDMMPAIKGSGLEEGLLRAVADQVPVEFSTMMPTTHRWFKVNCYPSEEGLTVLIKDFTVEKKAQEQVFWTKSNLEGIINNTEDLIWSINTEKIYVFVNNAYKIWLYSNFSITHVEGSKLYEQLYSSENAIHEWDSYYTRVLSGEQFSIIYESEEKATHGMISFEVSFNPIYNEKREVTGAGCFARNITQRLKAEQAIQAQNDRLREIASLSSHQLRRPVATIIGLIDIMDKKNLSNPENHKIVEHLQTESKELDTVIRVIVNKTFIEDVLKNGSTNK